MTQTIEMLSIFFDCMDKVANVIGWGVIFAVVLVIIAEFISILFDD